jgi:DNA-directed RNA polymerase subunit RPC12/RpoP
MEIPMLDEDEFAVVAKLYSEAFSCSKEFRLKHNLPLGKCPIDLRFRPMRDAYERMTGFVETNQKAILHHRISLYGEACENCGKPLRTPRASFCAACGKTVDSALAESRVTS